MSRPSGSSSSKSRGGHTPTGELKIQVEPNWPTSSTQKTWWPFRDNVNRHSRIVYGRAIYSERSTEPDFSTILSRHGRHTERSRGFWVQVDFRAVLCLVSYNFLEGLRLRRKEYFWGWRVFAMRFFHSKCSVGGTEVKSVARYWMAKKVSDHKFLPWNLEHILLAKKSKTCGTSVSERNKQRVLWYKATAVWTRVPRPDIVICVKLHTTRNYWLFRERTNQMARWDTCRRSTCLLDTFQHHNSKPLFHIWPDSEHCQAK